MKAYFKSGSWNADCDVCGFTYKSDELKERWDGLRVCSKDFELRNPQDLIRVPKEDPSVPWARPTSPEPYSCSVFNSVGIAGVGYAGCAVTGRINLLT